MRQCAHPQEKVQEVYQFHSETKSVVSMNENDEENDCHQFSVKVYHPLSEVGFQLLTVQHFYRSTG